MESVAVLMQAEEQAADRTQGRILRSVWVQRRDWLWWSIEWLTRESLVVLKRAEESVAVSNWVEELKDVMQFVEESATIISRTMEYRLLFLFFLRRLYAVALKANIWNII